MKATSQHTAFHRTTTSSKAVFIDSIEAMKLSDSNHSIVEDPGAKTFHETMAGM